MKKFLTLLRFGENIPYKIVVGALFVSMLTACGLGKKPTNFNTGYRVFIPQTAVATGVADIDGLNSDAKWNDAFHLDLIEGTTVSGVLMDGVSDASNLYLYFEIEENDIGPTDRVIIALQPNESNANDKRLLIITPCPTPASCPATGDSIPVTTIAYFTDANNDGNWEAAGGHGVTAAAATAAGTTWSLEVMIPRGAPFNLPATNYFGLYANILETTNALVIATQYTWPFNDDGLGTLLMGTPEGTPASGTWGNATFDTRVGNGVSIYSSDISTNHGPSTISSTEPNEFYATARNDTIDAGGNLVTAQNVSAVFKWANFGLASHNMFQRIPTEGSPAPGNPTSTVNILPTSSHTYQLNWTVPAADRAFYKANAHWCIRVELASQHPNTVISQPSAQVNMNFVDTSSPFISRATIDARGYKLPSGKRVHEYILEERFYNFRKGLKWESRLSGVKKIAKSTYALQVQPREPQKIRLQVQPPVAAMVPSERFTIKPGAAAAKNINVRPGQLVTIMSIPEFASTLPPVIIDSTAGGVARGGEIAVANPDTPRRPVFSPPQLIASWDGFRKSKFAVGGNISLKAPKGAKNLSLRVVGEKSKQTKTPVRVRAYVTNLEDYHLSTNPALRLDRGPNGIVNLGANLPTVVYRGKKDTGRSIKINKKTFKVYQSTGSFGYIVRGKKGEK